MPDSQPDSQLGSQPDPAETRPGSPPSGMFAPPPTGGGLSRTTLGIAAAAVLILLAVLIPLSRRQPAAAANTPQPLDAYAPSLALTGIKMSEAGSLAGGKSTYIDGHIANHGQKIVTAVTLQVLFANDEKLPPQIETVPLTLIHMREPYIDIQPVSAAPLAPGAEADFRLIFENIHDNWNQQQPELHITQVATK